MDSLLKWLQGNVLGMVLGAICGSLLVVWLLLAIMASLPLAPSSAEQSAGAGDAALNLPVLAENLPLDNYSVINERPLFNEDRRPAMEDVAGEEPAPELESSGEKPQVELAGVVITPSLRMVTLKRKDGEQSLVAFEGRPVEAEFGGWQVSRVQPRAATLRSPAGEELLLEMQVHDATIEPPPPVVKKDQAEGKNADPAAQDGAASQPLSRADEIRQRIAERREELRREAEAEQGNEGAQADDKPAQPSYQQAIRSMIGRGRQKKSDNQSEQ
jgi:hypothetical protein